MFIVYFFIAILIGFIIGCLNEKTKLRKKERECLNKKQMIENRDQLIADQEQKITELQHNSLQYERIKEIYKVEEKLIDRHDKIKELIEKDN